MADAIDKEEGSDEGARRKPVRLNGAYRFKVDDKGRVALPAKFRKVLPAQLTVARELENDCLYVFVPEDYEEWIDRLFARSFGEFDDANKEHQRLMMGLKSMADDVVVDKTGRIMLPQESRTQVGIDKDVVIVGENGRFDIWDAKRYDEAMSSIDLSVFYKSAS